MDDQWMAMIKARTPSYDQWMVMIKAGTMCWWSMNGDGKAGWLI